MPVQTDACDISTLATESACYNCLSEREKWQAVEYLLRQAYNAGVPSGTVTFAQLRQAAACLNCEPDSVLTSMLVRVTANLAVETGGVTTAPTVASLRSHIRCSCGVERKELKALILWLLCRSTVLTEQVPCWVAREVYGAADPRWRVFRSWLMGPARGWLRALYTGYGRGFARWIADKPRVKRVVRWLMDRVVNR